jgi:hypothetical protein
MTKKETLQTMLDDAFQRYKAAMSEADEWSNRLNLLIDMAKEKQNELKLDLSKYTDVATISRPVAESLAEEVVAPFRPGTLVEEIYKVLHAAKKPLHINEVTEEISKSSYSGRAQNLRQSISATLTRYKDHFESVRRGVYKLVPIKATAVKAEKRKGKRGRPRKIDIVSTRQGKETLASAIRRVMRVAGKPMHYRDIMTALEAEGFPISGQSPERNVVAHLVRMREVKRVTRGTYELEID